ncbi:hypothetical protein WI38_30200 [Burkholderia ubonensis]|uniref:Alpha/beta hydrolase n=1 Tax=Burkholderia ubonensis TaxID=101571 RepID=A0A124L7Q3_9BURK|nr:hypothetical protein WI35_24620 [Burkholderia ubonensis]KUZ73068.1 hypothetical protein WI37_22900 [Burkholderia ubonensis]KUZ81722.1 hypothetical protein WI38_30200 [Burkholderia ubonensis]KVA05134.1 hypothetical protein WI39_01795 [Burkholderia ubonensis]
MRRPIVRSFWKSSGAATIQAASAGIAVIAVAGDRRPQLAAIKAPTLVIHGADDPLFLPDCGRDTASSIIVFVHGRRSASRRDRLRIA